MLEACFVVVLIRDFEFLSSSDLVDLVELFGLCPLFSVVFFRHMIIDSGISRLKYPVSMNTDSVDEFLL